MLAGEPSPTVKKVILGLTLAVIIACTFLSFCGCAAGTGTVSQASSVPYNETILVSALPKTATGFTGHRGFDAAGKRRVLSTEAGDSTPDNDKGVVEYTEP